MGAPISRASHNGPCRRDHGDGHAAQFGSTYRLEEVAQAATGPIWFQQYFYKDQGLTQRMAHRGRRRQVIAPSV